MPSADVEFATQRVATTPSPSATDKQFLKPQASSLNPCANDAREDAEGEPDPVPDGEGPEGEVEELLRLADAGELAPLRVELPPLPPNAPVGVVAVAEFYAQVLGLRRAVLDERDVPFSGRWVAKHVGLPSRSVYRILDALDAAGVIVKTGVMPRLRGHLHGTALYAPGEVPDASVSVEGRAELVGDALEPEAHLRNESLVHIAERAVGQDSAFAAGGEAGVDDHGSDRTTLVGGTSAVDREAGRDA